MVAPMFSADFSWADPNAETVGQRRERKLRLRDANASSASFTSDESASKASFWFFSRKKSKSPAPKCPAPKSPARQRPPRHKPPANDSSWSLPAAALPPPPSPATSASVPPGHSIIGRRSSHRCASRHDSHAVSTSCRVSADGPVGEKKIVDQVQLHEVQQLSEGSYISRTTVRSTEMRINPPNGAVQDAYVSPYHTDSASSVSAPESVSSHAYAPDDTPNSASQTPEQSHAQPCNWQAPSDWDIASSRSYEVNRHSLDDVFLGEPDAAELTRFQRYIRRMESAGPRVILNRLNAEPPAEALTDPEAHEEMETEKHLWVLTALQLQNKQNSLVPNQGVGPLLGLPTLFRQPKRVLELYSNLAEVYQLSAIYPKSKISYLTTRRPLPSIPLPSNVSPLVVPGASILPLPYAANTFNHIRASSLPAQIPSSHILPLLGELYRLLAPGGILELRLVDPTPVRATMGPRMRWWFEECLLLRLESGFRCTRPLALVPNWVKEVGFSVLEGGATGRDSLVRRLHLPACAQPAPDPEFELFQFFDTPQPPPPRRQPDGPENMKRGGGIDYHHGLDDVAEEEPGEKLHGELAALVARGLWRDVWGPFVDAGRDSGADGCAYWWWEDPEVVRECWDYGTTFECGSMFAYKE